MTIRTKVEFSGVPKGTEGEITNVEYKKSGEALYAVQWNLPNRSKPLVDWFTQEEKDRYLEEV